MPDAWRKYRGAPADGTPVCTVAEVPEGGTLCLELGGFPLLIVRLEGSVRAFVNACPHQYLPLNHKGERLISADRTILRCTNHAAGFSVETGEGVEGLGIGECLDAVPVHLEAKTILIGNPPTNGDLT